MVETTKIDFWDATFEVALTLLEQRRHVEREEHWQEKRGQVAIGRRG
jgi:hypothetical protein